MSETASAVVSLINNVFSFLIGRHEKTTKTKEEIVEEISKKQEELRTALRLGRVSDAGALARHIAKLYSKLPLIILLLCMASCRSRHPEYQMPPVLGERIFIVKPGETVQVPELVEPSRKWYLVDDVGLCQWLGIPTEVMP